jgi:hypothetical protein
MISFECKYCHEENFIEVETDDFDHAEDFDTQVISGWIKILKFDDHVRISHDDWQKIHEVWKEAHKCRA